jgi:hypothetical protein
MVSKNEAAPKLECPAVESLTVLDDIAGATFGAAFANAVLDRSPGRFTVVAAKLVDLVWASEEPKRQDKRNALRLMAGLHDYAATYAPATDSTGKAPTADELHQQRTKILESLTDDMTNRAGRGGDCIFSLGGALRAAGGVRIGTQTKGSTFFGPRTSRSASRKLKGRRARKRAHRRWQTKSPSPSGKPSRAQRSDGTPEGTRTPDRWIRNPLLYPAELRARVLLT